jgi:hypothetical protein
MLKKRYVDVDPSMKRGATIGGGLSVWQGYQMSPPVASGGMCRGYEAIKSSTPLFILNFPAGLHQSVTLLTAFRILKFI